MREMTYKEAIHYLQPVADNTPLYGYGTALLLALRVLEAADAQVHCRDCRHWTRNYGGNHGERKYCTLAGYTTKPDGFCCYGERRTK